MGNQVATTFRGDDDVSIAQIINAITDQEYSTFLKQAADASELGENPQEEYKRKADLIAALESIDTDIKKQIVKNYKEGKSNPFL